MNVRYRVDLTEYERNELGALLSGGKHEARKLKRAQILLAADAGVNDEEIATSVGVGGSTVYRTKRRFVAVQIVLQVLLEVLDRHPVYAGCALVRLDLLPRLPDRPLRDIERLARCFQLVHATPPGEHPG